MKRRLFFIVFLSISFSLKAQDDKNFPSLSEKNIPGGKITRTSYYGGDALWGIINGGADIYLEYGFDKLLFQEIEWKGIKFRVEFYRMNNSKSAFGIFSVSRYKCSMSNTLTKYICITPYQVQAAVGKFYASVANDKGNKEAQQQTLEIFSKYLGTINEQLFVLPDLFRKIVLEPYKNQMKLMKGRLGLQNGFPIWSEMFEPFSNYEIYLMTIELENGYVYISQIKFESEKATQLFINENQTNPGSKLTKSIKPISSNEIIFIESNLLEADLIKFTDSINHK